MATKSAISSSVSRLRDILSEKLEERGGGTGITTFISEVLREGRAFTRRDVLARRTKKKSGQSIGRRLDAAVRNVIDKHTTNTLLPVPVTKDKSDISKRLVSVFRCLRRHNVFPVCAQTLVRDQELGIRSYADAIGITLDGHVVVIELKATAVTLSHHRQLYHLPASRAPLKNGLPDTEAVHHSLQAGFGALAAKLTFPALAEFSRVRSCVVVSCKDSSELYWTPERFYARRLFSVPGQRPVSLPAPRRPNRGAHASSKRSAPKVVITPWPLQAPGLKAALPTFGYSPIAETSTGALAKLRPLAKSNVHGLAVVITRPWNTLAPSTQTAIEAHLASQCDAITFDGSARRAAGLVIYPGRNGSWGITRVCMVAVAANVV